MLYHKYRIEISTEYDGTAIAQGIARATNSECRYHLMRYSTVRFFNNDLVVPCHAARLKHTDHRLLELPTSWNNPTHGLTGWPIVWTPILRAWIETTIPPLPPEKQTSLWLYRMFCNNNVPHPLRSMYCFSQRKHRIRAIQSGTSRCRSSSRRERWWTRSCLWGLWGSKRWGMI